MPPPDHDHLEGEHDKDASHRASMADLRKQKHKHHHSAGPTAGPSEDDRFGAGANAVNAHGRILAISVVGNRSLITIGLGKAQGIGVGMEGYIKAEDGMLADFQIGKVDERTCQAFVDMTPDGIGHHNDVIVNPTSIPKKAQPQHDIEARIIGVSIEGGRTKIMIARGISNGARAGMAGYVIGETGKNIADFTVAEQFPRHCVAYVDLIIDQIHHSGGKVMLNPSKG